MARIRGVPYSNFAWISFRLWVKILVFVLLSAVARRDPQATVESPRVAHSGDADLVWFVQRGRSAKRLALSGYRSFP